MDHLHILLLVGAIPFALMTGIIRFALSMHVVPEGPDNDHEVIKTKKAIKTHKRLSMIFASLSALLFLAFFVI